MYKGDPQGTLEWRGPNPDPYHRMYEKDNNEDAGDWSDLIALLDTLDNLTANLDSCIGSGHNYYLYRRRSDDKWTFFPRGSQ